MTTDWLSGTTHKDWLIDGHPCTAKDWANLDWTHAFVDMGPSTAGNPGPYWHVFDKEHDCQHRLYPKVLQTKWLGVIRRAITETRERTETRGSYPQTKKAAPR